MYLHSPSHYIFWSKIGSRCSCCSGAFWHVEAMKWVLSYMNWVFCWYVLSYNSVLHYLHIYWWIYNSSLLELGLGHNMFSMMGWGNVVERGKELMVHFLRVLQYDFHYQYQYHTHQCIIFCVIHFIPLCHRHLDYHTRGNVNVWQ